MKRFPLVLPKTRKKQSKTRQSKSKSIIYCLSIDVKLRYFLQLNSSYIVFWKLLVKRLSKLLFWRVAQVEPQWL